MDKKLIYEERAKIKAQLHSLKYRKDCLVDRIANLERLLAEGS